MIDFEINIDKIKKLEELFPFFSAHLTHTKFILILIENVDSLWILKTKFYDGFFILQLIWRIVRFFPALL